MTRLINSLACFGSLTLMAAGALAGPDYEAVAKNLVNESLDVQPGEVIQVTGTPDQIELMEAIFVAVRKAGGEPLVTLQLPQADKRAMLETPMEHLKRIPTTPVMLSRMIDGLINVATLQDPDLMADVPEDRLAVARKAGSALNHVFRNANFRSVSLGQVGGMPTRSYAQSIDADYEELEAMFWRALAVSPEQIREAATLVNGLMAPGTDVHVTSPTGTDLRFRLANKPPRVNAGRTADVTGHGPKQVWLPAGEAYTVIEPGSARGKIVVERAMFRGKAIEDLTLTFRDGKVTDIEGDNVQMLRDFFAASDDASSMLSIIDIGLNPHSRSLENSDYLSWEMGGLVTLGIGNNNWAGGDNAGDGAYSVHIPRATVEVGGTRLTSNGELPQRVLAVYKSR